MGCREPRALSQSQEPRAQSPQMAETAPQLPSELPVLPLRRTVALPLTLQPLAVNRPVSIETVNRALGVGPSRVPRSCRTTTPRIPGPNDLLQVGTVGVIRQMAKVPSGINVIIEGLVARPRDAGHAYRHEHAGADRPAAGNLRTHDRGRSPHPPHPGTDREGAVALDGTL